MPLYNLYRKGWTQWFRPVAIQKVSLHLEKVATWTTESGTKIYLTGIVKRYQLRDADVSVLFKLAHLVMTASSVLYFVEVVWACVDISRRLGDRRATNHKPYYLLTIALLAVDS